MAASTESPKTLNERLDQARAELKEAADRLQDAARKAGETAEARLQALREELKKTAEQIRRDGIAKTARSVVETSAGSLRVLASQAVSTLGLPTQEDVETLNRKLENLSRKIRRLEKSDKNEKADAA